MSLTSRVLVALLSLSGIASAQIVPAEFAAPRDQLAQSPYATVVADFNADTLGDIAFVNAYHQSVTVLINGAATRIPVGSRPADLAVADFNADLRQDLVVANSGSATISVLLGAGDGTFAPAQSVVTGLRPIMVAVADFNGDANQDVAVANAGSSNVSVLAGNGDGTFGSPLRLPLDAAPSAIIAADFNHDLYTDLAVGSARGITVLRGTGLGTFLPALTSPAAVVTIADFVASDFDLDGNLDLAAADSEGATLRVYLGDGTGAFPAAEPITGSYKLYSLVLADVNEDALLDLVAGGYRSGAVVFIRRPDGRLGAPSVVLASGDMYSAAVGDLDGDDHLDLVAASLRTLDDGGRPPDAAFPVGTLSIRFGRGDGTFSEVPRAGGRINWPVTADFNGDGRADLAILVRGRSSTCGIAVALSTDEGGLQALPTIPHPGGVCFLLAVGDFNDDGRPDLLAPATGGLQTLLGNGDGTFAFGPAFAALMELPSLGIGDINGDEHLDLAYIGRDSQFNRHLYIQTGNGDGSFDAPAEVVFETQFNLFGLTVADVNGDARDDIAVLTGAPKHLSVLHGNGDGTFQFPVDVFTGVSDRDLPLQIVSGDVNDDGKSDLVVGNYSGSVSVVLQRNGSLQPAVTYFMPYQPRAISVADVNGDLMSDLVVLNSNTLSILLGRGDGIVALQPAGFSALDSGREMAVADLTSDGRADVVVTNYGSEDSLVLIVNVTPAAPRASRE